MLRMNNDLLGKLGLLGLALVFSTSAVPGCGKSDDGGEEMADETTGDGDEVGDGDGDTTGDGDGDTTGDGDGDGDPCAETHTPGDGAADGEACFSNSDCASKLCEVYQDAPPVEGVCAPAPEMCETRIMGRTLDFTTREPAPDIMLRVAQAIPASVDPVNAAGLAVDTSDAMGIIDTLSDGQIESPLGIIGLAEGTDYYLTATGLAGPVVDILYGPANDIHDIWVVPSGALSSWSDMLMPDPEFANLLPLGENGGVVGLVRDEATGEPVAGGVVVPTAPDSSNAVIRYLNEAGDGFIDTETSTMGVFVIVDPGLGETFGVELGGVPVDGVEGTAGSANGAIFTLIMDVTP